MRWDGLLVETHADVYQPGDDTFLLAGAVQDRVGAGMHFVEVGCGAGLVSLAAARAGAAVLAIDRNPLAAALTRHNARSNGLAVDAVVGDLLQPLRGPIDVVAFNPPYLPTAPDEVLEGPINLAFDGGPDGNQTVLRFAGQLERLEGRPTVLVVHSSLSDPGPLDQAMARLGYRMAVAAEEKLPYEVLTVRTYVDTAS